MTAIVGILNKHGIAVAADSAETIGRGVKIYNKANKIFNLSKYHPIGAAVYGSANFANLTPWDIIFKLYRENLKKNYFPKLENYTTDFLEYIIKNSFFADSKELEAEFNNQVKAYYSEYVIQNRIGNGKKQCDYKLEQLIPILEDIKKTFSSFEPIDSLKDITEEQFCNYIQEAISYIKAELTKKKLDYNSIEKLLKETLYLSFTRKENLHVFSGVAIFGYGDNEIYPSIQRLKIYGAVCGKLKWYIEEIWEVTNNNNAVILPMAQSDVMMTVLKGIEPKLQQSILDLAAQLIQENIKQIASTVKKSNQKLADDISNIDIQPTFNLFKQNIDNLININHVGPLITTIGTLQKEDLAEVAENLIYLTSLIRRITPDQESVGGPIDVALLSKGDGFVWIKRKHYFEESLNKHYNGKYFTDSHKKEGDDE